MNNLRRRKLRSALTMLGVVIGTAAIVVTISLGYGAEAAQMQQLEAATNLRLVQVYPFYSYTGSATSATGARITRITDSVVNRIRGVSHVAAVTPQIAVYGMEFILATGKYECSTGLLAVYPEDFAKIQGLKSGKYFTRSTSKMEFIMSEMQMLEFHKEKEEAEWVDVWTLLEEGEELPLPKIDWLDANFTFRMQWEDPENTDSEGNPELLTKEIPAKMRGIIAADLNDYTYSYNAVVNLNWMKKLYRENKQLFKEQGMPDFTTYDNLVVLADKVDNVSDMVKELTDMGLQCYSELTIVEQFREQIRTVQAFLGFIGAISMLVAALSIANTMMMSIYERTREIGVMKVLGCRLSNIRALFLTEAAYIGVFGGALGLVVSYTLSYLLNNVEWMQQLVSSIMASASYLGGTEGANTSIIPPQLALTTWGFVILISIASGIQPARRAMKLSSLEAIRGE